MGEVVYRLSSLHAEVMLAI